MKQYVKRMESEFEELAFRVGRIKKFIESNPAFDTLPESEKKDMEAQAEAMECYLTILGRRISRAKSMYYSPTSEQMEALAVVISDTSLDEGTKSKLEGLFNELKEISE